MNQRTETQAVIKKLGINGEGIAYINKKITFVQGALPGEEVKIRIVREEPRYMVGELVDITAPSAARVRPKCGQQRVCRGCPMMILSYPEQLKSKEQLTRDTFEKYVPNLSGKTVFESIDPAPSQYGVRNIVRLPVVRFQDRVTFGIYQRDTKYLNLMRDCPMQSKRINTLLNDLEMILNQMHLRAYDDLKRKGIRFLTVREFDNGLQLIFVTGSDKLPERALEAISRIENVTSVIVTINTERHSDFDTQRYENKLGKGQMEQIFMQRRFTISSKADFPTNRLNALRMAKTMDEWIGPEVKYLIDAGCGVGLYSLGLREDISIYGVDENRISVMDAINNARVQKREKAFFEDGSPSALFTAQSKKQRPDLLMMHMDALRFDDEFIQSVLQSKIPSILMESSHVSQLAKQCAELSNRYDLTRVKAFDAQPNGSGISALALLKLKTKR